MTTSALSDSNASRGQSTNCAKLQIIAAFTSYSRERASPARVTPVKALRVTQRNSRILRLFFTFFVTTLELERRLGIHGTRHLRRRAVQRGPIFRMSVVEQILHAHRD